MIAYHCPATGLTPGLQSGVSRRSGGQTFPTRRPVAPVPGESRHGASPRDPLLAASATVRWCRCAVAGCFLSSGLSAGSRSAHNSPEPNPPTPQLPLTKKGCLSWNGPGTVPPSGRSRHSACDRIPLAFCPPYGLTKQSEISCQRRHIRSYDALPLLQPVRPRICGLC